MPLSSTSSRLSVPLLIAAAALVLVPSLFTRDPWNPDEPRATEVAREMVALGNYLVPHLNGEPYSDKPPLFYWLAAGFWHLGFGVNSGRMVSLLATVGIVLVVFALGRRLHSPETGLLAGLVSLTTLLLVFICKFGVLDPLLTFLTTGSIYCVVRALEGSESHGLWWLAAYVAAALAVLTKGPVGLAVPLLVGLGYGAARRREVRKGGWWHLAGAAVMVALVAAWLVPACIQGGPSYTKDILFQQTAQRMGEDASHYQAPYFYLAYAPVFLFPWSLVLVLALGWAWRVAWTRGDAAGVLSAVWFIGVLVFFSLFSGKRERYLLPLVPAVGLLCARYAVAVGMGEVVPSRGHRGLWKATFVLLGLLAVGLVVVAMAPGEVAARLGSDAEVREEVRAAMTPAVLAGAGVFGVAILAACFYGMHARPDGGGERRRLSGAVAAALLLSLAVDLLATPILDRFKSGRDLIEQAGSYIRDADEVVLYQSEFSGVYNLFSRRVRMPAITTPEELGARFASGRRVTAIVKERALAELAKRAKFHQVASERVGHRKLVVIANWEAAR